MFFSKLKKQVEELSVKVQEQRVQVAQLQEKAEQQNLRVQNLEKDCKEHLKWLEALQKNMELSRQEEASLRTQTEQLQNSTVQVQQEQMGLHTQVEHLQNAANQMQYDFEQHKQDKQNDHWMTKYGFDTAIAKLQLDLVELRVPGNRERLEALRATNNGKKCFVLGNGPSLRIEDLNLLHEKNVFCFASKGIFLTFSDTEWRPDVWGVSDAIYIKHHKGEISALEGFPKLVCAQSIIDEGIQIKDAIYYPHLQMHRTPQWFNADVTKGVHWWGTITCKLINFAVFMGFKEIYLLGVDHNYPIVKNEDGSYRLDTTQNSHFNVGKEYQTPQEMEEMNRNISNFLDDIKYMDESYKSIRWYCEQLGVQIYNATRGGKLEAFERKNVEDVLKNW